jgi:hypothetical protein
LLYNSNDMTLPFSPEISSLTIETKKKKKKQNKIEKIRRDHCYIRWWFPSHLYLWWLMLLPPIFFLFVPPLFFYLFDVINIPLGCIAVVGNEGMSINYHERHHLFSSFSFMLFGFPQQQVRVARRREEGAGSQTNPSINYL